MKALVLFSGGLDSTTCLAKAIKEYGHENVIALSVAYGQKHIKELEASKKITEYYKVKHISFDLKKIFEGSTCTLLSSSKEDIPLFSYEDQSRRNDNETLSTYVPFRNGLFLSVAASVAISNGCELIYYGAHSDDSIGNAYPDTSDKFNNAINEAIYLGSGKKLKVKAPFISHDKARVVKEGAFLEVPFKYTWSCYNGYDKACGRCATCIDRLKAFRANNLKDPIEYEEGYNE